MPLTKNFIASQAERYGFTVTGYEPGPGVRADATLKDNHNDQTVKIGLWPEYSEAELARLLSMASVELRGSTIPTTSADAWLM